VKLLEKLFINYTNKNEHGYTPQNITNHVALTLENVLTDRLTSEDVLVVVSLAVKGASDAAWWPAILNGLRAYE